MGLVFVPLVIGSVFIHQSGEMVLAMCVYSLTLVHGQPTNDTATEDKCSYDHSVL